ncbi:E3 ubiquitin-protein ligase NEDD4 [Mytilinidion resinicola]|uniref:HECT-type E3 ubiquitin transferase n=1 Tax=Mytilinidion resinicola TaxID=574789 RepID=A0A6A6YTP3_9PEZI|nr:E3 ubiquitin-protein ligase NEDD4 [Mytilinidion resinicola]KAF2812292.1 E3 ubiquitin-protein ligase NEDD4 [Mytilinidion resinicola]
MFTTFSGSTRRPRQVNLSGRGSSGFGNIGSGSGSQAALDRAQQERQQRQRERDRLRAAKLLQRAWRGHSTRQGIRKELLQQWDVIEDSVEQPQPYASEAEALGQLQRLLNFVQTRNEEDIRRVRHFGARQIQTFQVQGIDCSGGPWPLAYLRLQKLVLAILDRRCKPHDTRWGSCRGLVAILRFLAERIPAQTAQNAKHFYSTLAAVAQNSSMDTVAADKHVEKVPGDDLPPFALITEAAVAPLTTLAAYTLNAYEAFGASFLTTPILTETDDMDRIHRPLGWLADSINYKLLASALSTMINTAGLGAYPELTETSGRIRLLGCFIYFHRHAHNFNNPQAYSSQKDFVSVVSALLNSLPTEIVEGQTRDPDQPEDLEQPGPHFAMNPFLQEQILSLVNQESVGSLLSNSSSAPASSHDEKVEEARQLANYALSLLRFFPRRGDDIRMWLYLGPSPSSAEGSSQTLPAIKYFWEATKRSSIFGSIIRDSRAAIQLLKAKPSGTEYGWQAPNSDLSPSAQTSDEWRVILVFLELYTFVLKVMDDEEFFSGHNTGYTSRASASSMTRDNALPLTEVKDLTTFLKNLGFTLYFNAADIVESEDQDSTRSVSFHFSNNAAQISEQLQQTMKAVEPSVGGVAGLTIDYVKGLVTGLLRMVYERDSRRSFLPADHWLMASRLDMTGFIPTVVEEEESRHRIEEEDAEDAIQDDGEDELEDTNHLIGTSRAQQARRLERLQRQQRKASRRRYLQAVAPRLEILQNMPFLIPFTTRVQIFREFVSLNMTKRRGSADAETWRVLMMNRPDAPQQFEKHHAKIHRGNEFDDAFAQFYSLGEGLKEPIQITFVDQFGAAEAGIDGGGVTKEFLTSVTQKAFNPSDGIDLFIDNNQHLLYPNPSAVQEQKELLREAGLDDTSIDFRLAVLNLLQRYEFMGRIIGKCLYEGILVDVNFAPFFLRKWALTGGSGSAPNESGYRATLNDLRDLDEELYDGLHQLKNYTGDVEDFSLNFTVTDTVKRDHHNGATKTVTRELKPDGSNIPVTNRNRLVYISYVARHRLQNEPAMQTNAFLRGLSTMINPSWLSMFNHSELQTLVGGTSTSIDLDDLRRNTIYGGVYQRGDDGRDHPTIELFWRVMEKFDDGERRAVLKFVTSTPRSPLLGFSTLRPPFSIRDGGGDEERLPSTSTCVNLLKLPVYKDENVLKEKLLYSVFSGAGFDLS